MNILIAGDSFAVDAPGGWASMLAGHFKVTNLAEPGVGEYKIYKQLKSVNIPNFDCVIVSHTSYSRIHTLSHPIHKKGFYKNCDLIFTDIESFQATFNKSLEVAKGWFKYHYDDEYQKDIYKLIRQDISRLINVPYLSIDNLNNGNDIIFEKNHLDLRDIWPKYKGKINHYTEEGNLLIYKEVSKFVNSKQ